jgi:serine/threonine protein kinase
MKKKKLLIKKTEMSTRAFLKAHEIANQYSLKEITTIKNLKFDDPPQDEFDDEISSDIDQYETDSDSDEDPAENELDELEWSRKMDAVIFQFTQDFEIIKPFMNRSNRKVYLALRKTDNLPVTIIISKDYNRSQMQNDVPREIILMSRVNNHQNVVQLLGWKRISRKIFAMLMPYYIDCPLSTCFWSHFLMGEYMYGLLNGINYLHRNKICHRDIAKQNVMWDPLKKRVVIIDLDNSAMIRDTLFVREVGRDDYDSPEKAGTFLERPKSRGYDESSDIYSAGIIFYMLLHELESPPSAKSLKNFIKKAFQRRTYLHHIEIDLLLKMLYDDPTKRITSYDALQHKFFEVFVKDEKYNDVEEKLHELIDFEDEEREENIKDEEREENIKDEESEKDIKDEEDEGDEGDEGDDTDKEIKNEECYIQVEDSNEILLPEQWGFMNKEFQVGIHDYPNQDEISYSIQQVKSQLKKQRK